MKYSRIPLHKVTIVARTIGAARPPLHTSPKPSISPPRVNVAQPSAVSVAMVNAANPSAVSAARVNAANPSAVSAARVNAANPFAVSVARVNAANPSAVSAARGNLQQALQDKCVIDSGRSRHMTGYVAFGGNPKGGKITGK
nr:hypothetical protein [Tanacetum cinerariifolium]